MPHPTDDPTLDQLQSWHGGDRAALDALIADNVDWVRRHVHQRLRPSMRDAGETQDFVQNAMVAVLEYGPRFEITDRERFRALIARIVENDLRDGHRYLRRDRRDVRRNKGPATDTILKLDPAAHSVTSPSRHASRDERREWIRLALELLDPPDREVIRSRDWEQLTFAAAGARLGISEDGARKRYERALPKLARKVAQLRAGRIDGGA